MGVIVIVGISEGPIWTSSEELERVWVPDWLASSVLVVPFTVDSICTDTSPSPDVTTVLVAYELPSVISANTDCEERSNKDTERKNIGFA